MIKGIKQSVEELPILEFEQYFNFFDSNPDAIRLDIGEPNFPTPSFICNQAKEFISTGKIRYNAGMELLKKSIIEAELKNNNVRYNENEVIITKGAIGGLLATLETLIEEGDEVVIPDPCWPSLVQMVRILGARPVYYPFLKQSDKKNLVPNLSKIVTQKTKAIIINSPHNPTGLSLSIDDINPLVEFITNHSSYIITDDTYEHIIYDDKCFISLASFKAIKDKVISIKSFSKTYCMTGWRIGAVLSSDNLIREINKINELATGGVSIVSQIAALAALNGPQEGINKRKEMYQHKRDIIIEILDKNGIEYTYTEGSFFIFIKIGSDNSKSFVQEVFSNYRVALMPGYLFGKNGEGYVRLSLTASSEELIYGINAILSNIKNQVRLV